MMGGSAGNGQGKQEGGFTGQQSGGQQGGFGSMRGQGGMRGGMMGGNGATVYQGVYMNANITNVNYQTMLVYVPASYMTVDESGSVTGINHDAAVGSYTADTASIQGRFPESRCQRHTELCLCGA